MGFLMRPRLPDILVLLLCAGAAGCTPFNLRESVRLGDGDWTMYGGNPGRTNATSESLVPPLAVRWEYDASAGFSSFSASAAESLVFVGTLRGEVHAVRLRTGEGAGARDFGSAVVGTPVVGRQGLFVALSGDENSLAAYDLANGVMKWEAKLGDIESSPLLAGEKLYVASLGGTISCLDASTGSVLWTHALPAARRSSAVRSSPAIDGETLVVGCDDGMLYALSAADGTRRWSAKTGASIAGTPSISTGRVFVGSLDENLYAFDARDGALLWKRPLGAKIYASPAVDAHRVCIGTSDGSFAALHPETGEILWQASLNGVVSAAALIAGSVVYVPCLDKTLTAFDASTGERLWQYSAPGRIKSSPVLVRGFLVILTEDRSVIGLSEGGAE